MRTLSANDVQKFLAGVVAYIGFQALVQSALLLAGPSETDSATIIVSAIPSLALLIGLRMFMGKPHAVSWAILLIAFCMVLGVAGATRLYLTSSIAFSYFFIMILNPAIVLGALLWYRFKLLPYEPNAQQIVPPNAGRARR